MARAERPWRIGHWLLGGVLGLLLLVTLVLAGLQTHYAREQLRVRANAALAGLFQGRIEIESIGGVGPWGVRDVDARVFDASGRQVLLAQGVSAYAFLPGLAWQLLAHADAPSIDISLVRIRRADVRLREDAELGVSLGGAFLPAQAQANPAQLAGSGPRLRIERLSLVQAWVHGRAAGSPPLDGDLDQLSATLWQSPRDGFHLALERVDLKTRALPLAIDPRGRLSGSIDVPAGESGPLRLAAALDGSAAGSPLSLEATWVGDDLFARVSLIRLPAAIVNRQVPSVQLDGDLTLVGEVEGQLPELDFSVELDGTAAHLSATGYAFLSGGLELGASVETTRFDLSRAVAGAPTSELAWRLHALAVEAEEGQLNVVQRLEVEPGSLAGQRTPELWEGGPLSLGGAGDLEARGKLGASDPGLALSGSYEVELPTDAPSRVGLELTTELSEPARLAALGVRATGSASLAVSLQPEARTFSGQARASLSHLDYRTARARHVELTARSGGSFDAPTARASLGLEVLSGRLHADLDYQPRRQALQLSAQDFELQQLLALAGVPAPRSDSKVRLGKAGLDAHAVLTSRSTRKLVDLRANARLGKLGTVAVTAQQFQLPEAMPTLAELAALRGQVELSGRVELGELDPLLDGFQLPLEHAAGRLRFDVSAEHERESAQGLALAAQLDSYGLRLVGKRPERAQLATTSGAVANDPWAIEGIDLHLSTHGRPREGVVVGTLLLRDKGGTLLDSEAELRLVGRAPRELTHVATLMQLPLKLRLEVPERRLQGLPKLLQPLVLHGRASLQAELEGSLAAPKLRAHAGVRALSAPECRAPIDVVVDLNATPGSGDVRATAALGAGRQVGSARVEWQGDVRRLSSAAARPSLRADVSAKLDAFPLDVVPWLVERQVRGQLSGEAELRDWGKQARLKARFTSTDLRVSKLELGDFVASARTGDDGLHAEVGVKIGQGSSRATLDAGLAWGERTLPELGRRAAGKLALHGFRLEALSPLLGDTVSELSGALDAETELSVTPSSTQVSGSARLAHGVVQLPAIGQRFSDISASLSVDNDQVQLEKLEARGTTGKLTARGSARLDGFSLRSADGHVAIAEHEKIPLTVEGAAVGDAWGDLDAKYMNPPAGEQTLALSVPRFHLLVPESGGKELQSLDRPDDVAVGVRRADGKFVALPVQPLEPGGKEDANGAEPPRPLRIQVTLGNDVVVERGRSAQAQLGGKLTILNGPETQVNGRIELRGGKLDVQGKTFVIERGVLSFEGEDPGNPTITATARWDAPEYTVYADYIGDLKDGHIKLHSEPPLNQDQIANLLLFGSPDSMASSAADPSAAALAVGVAGGTAAKG
jgi:autotransporter translocation and assembly factor TamB